MPQPRKPAAKKPPKEPEIKAVNEERRVVYAEPDRELAYYELARPFTPEAIKWKVQVNPKAEDKSAMVVAHIDARLVAARLDHVVPLAWSTEYLSVAHAQVGGAEAGKAVLCALTIMGTTRVDVGLLKGGDGADDEVRIKGGYSDALKRVAVQFGVGASLYAIPKMWIGKAQGAKVWEKGGKWKAAVDNDQAEAFLRRKYQEWLDQVGIPLFGTPISHGDVEGAQGDVEAGAVASEPAPAVSDQPFGPTASAQLEDTAGRALQFLHGFSGVEPAAVLAAIREQYDYLPSAALGGLGVYAKLVREQAGDTPPA